MSRTFSSRNSTSVWPAFRVLQQHKEALMVAAAVILREDFDDAVLDDVQKVIVASMSRSAVLPFASYPTARRPRAGRSWTTSSVIAGDLAAYCQWLAAHRSGQQPRPGSPAWLIIGRGRFRQCLPVPLQREAPRQHRPGHLP